MKYMVFFLKSGRSSRTEPLEGYNNGLEAVNSGPPGAVFQLTDISTDDYRVVLEGVVAR